MTNKILTEADIDYLESRLKTEFVTKADLQQAKSDLMDKLDKIIGIVSRNEEEATLISAKTIENTDALEDHEARLIKVESKLLLTSA